MRRRNTAEEPLDVRGPRARVSFAQLDQAGNVVRLQHQQAQQVIRSCLTTPESSHQKPEDAGKIGLESLASRPRSSDGRGINCPSPPETLATTDPYQFQCWARDLVGARPAEGKKGADKGIDGRIYFHEGDTGKTKQIILSVKARKLRAPYVRDVRGVIDRENAEIGVLLTLDEPTKAMRTEAASAGFYTSPWVNIHGFRS